MVIAALAPPATAVRRPGEDLGLPPEHRLLPPSQLLTKWDVTQTATVATATRCGKIPSLVRTLKATDIQDDRVVISPHAHCLGAFAELRENVPGLKDGVWTPASRQEKRRHRTRSASTLTPSGMSPKGDRTPKLRGLTPKGKGQAGSCPGTPSGAARNRFLTASTMTPSPSASYMESPLSAASSAPFTPGRPDVVPWHLQQETPSPVLRRSGSAPTPTQKSTALTLERALKGVYERLGTPLARTDAGVLTVISESRLIGGAWTPRKQSPSKRAQTAPSPVGGPVSPPRGIMTAPAVIGPSGLDGTEPEEEQGNGWPMLDRPVTPEGPQGRPESRGGARFTPARSDWPPQLDLGEPDLSDGALPGLQLPPLQPQEPEELEPVLTEFEKQRKLVSTKEVEVTDFFYDRVSKEGPNEAEKSEAAKEALRKSAPHEGPSRAGSSVRALRTPIFERYKNHTDLLQYFLGEGVDPDVFPEFPDCTMADETNEWYECTLCNKELSIGHPFTPQHCKRMNRDWAEFGRHNPQKNIASVGNKEQAPWRRPASRAKVPAEKDSLPWVRDVNERADWRRIADALKYPQAWSTVRGFPSSDTDRLAWVPGGSTGPDPPIPNAARID